jgi:hypothetical protein
MLPIPHQKIKTLEQVWEEVTLHLQALQEEQAKTRDLVERFRQGKLIPFHSLAEVGWERSILLAPGVECFRMKNEAQNHLVFVCEFQPQALLKSHYHDCEEQITVLKGHLIDLATGKKVLRSAHFPALRAHELYSPERTLCIVRFVQLPS